MVPVQAGTISFGGHMEGNRMALIAIIVENPDSTNEMNAVLHEYASFIIGRMGIPYRETTSLEEHLNDCDILYMTRVQQERFNDLMEYEKVKDVYRLTASMLCGVKPNMKILHPLPRVGEIDQDVDDTPYAYYFKQAENGLYVRMAIISYLLGYR